MSDTTASLRRKIKSAGDLQSVVRTMKALAASNIGQYEESVRALEGYYRTGELGLSVCFRGAGSSAVGAEDTRRPDAIFAVVFGSDQGLVGQFNEAVVEHAIKTLSPLSSNLHVWAVGERVYARLADAGLSLAGLFSVPNSVQAIPSLVGKILVESETRRNLDEGSELHFVYNRLALGSGYESVSQRLLPLDEIWRRKLADLPWPTGNIPEVIGGAETLRAFIRDHLFVSIFRACAESLMSENASRLAAMQRADKNIDELLEGLNGTFHHLRQSGIDEELFDVISGFDAQAQR